MRTLALIAVLASSRPAVADTDAQRFGAASLLAARAQEMLDGVLGPGRAQIYVSVSGERSEVLSQTEITLPIDTSSGAGKALAAARLLDLPGYTKAPQPAPVFFQKEHEQSRRDAGFVVRSMTATAVLDAALDDAAVREVSQLLPQVLELDIARGDVLRLLRAPLRPAWKSAFVTPGDWRRAAYAVGGGLLALLTAFIVGAGLTLAGRSLGRELALRPRAEAGAAPGASAPEALPELTPGAAGFLDSRDHLVADSPPLLGRRFDFLAGRDLELIVRALTMETPEDLSVFFGHLAESIPDLASRLFEHLPADRQAEVSSVLLKLSLADPQRLGALEERLRRVVENGIMGPQSLGRILSRVPAEARADLLGRLAAQDVSAALEVERHVFAFEDLQGLGGAPLRRLLGAVPYEVWGPALRGAPSALVDAVLSDFPQGPRELVRSAAATAQSRETIASARSLILDALAALAARGEVTLGEAQAGRDLV